MITTLPQLDSPSAPSRPASVHPGDLISQLLQEQSTLTAVEQFSTWHQLHSEPEQAKYYRDLLPATTPIGGQQLAFEVDLDRCSGCKACVVACHSLNGLDDEESFRDVGLLLGTAETSAAFQHVTTACHHCVDPGCLSKSCGVGDVCTSGACVDPCIGAVCPSGQSCKMWACTDLPPDNGGGGGGTDADGGLIDGGTVETGCACRFAPAQNGSLAWGLFAGLGLFAVAMRRRRR